MTKLGPSRQVTKRRARDDIRAKMVLGVDLNTPPLEGHEQEASSGSGHPPVSQRTSVSITPRCNHPTGQQQGSLLSTNYGTNSLLIDVDAIEDEVQLLSSSRGFPQGRNCSRRNQPVTVVLDEDTDTHSRRSEGLVTMLSLDNHNKHERSSRNTAVINCEVYPDLEKEDNMKGKNVMESRPEPPKQPTFTCPICMNTMVEASSTICGHIFCQSCIKASIQFQKKCPTCRRKLTMNNFHKVYLPTTN